MQAIWIRHPPGLGLDSTPFTFALGGTVLLWPTGTRHVLELQAVARGVAFQDIHDALLVLDREDTIVGLNQAAVRLLSAPESRLVGR